MRAVVLPADSNFPYPGVTHGERETRVVLLLAAVAASWIVYFAAQGVKAPLTAVAIDRR